MLEIVRGARGPEETRARIGEGRLQSQLRSAMDSQAICEGGALSGLPTMCLTFSTMP